MVLLLVLARGTGGPGQWEALSPEPCGRDLPWRHMWRHEGVLAQGLTFHTVLAGLPGSL